MLLFYPHRDSEALWLTHAEVGEELEEDRCIILRSRQHKENNKDMMGTEDRCTLHNVALVYVPNSIPKPGAVDWLVELP